MRAARPPEPPRSTRSRLWLLDAIGVGVAGFVLALFGDLAGGIAMAVGIVVAFCVIFGLTGVAGAIATALGLASGQLAWLGTGLVVVGFGIGVVGAVRIMLWLPRAIVRVRAGLDATLESED